MKAIIYASVHHGNTKKVVEAIAKACEVDLIDAMQIKEKDLNGYEAIGPWKLIGGIAKGRPNDRDLKKAVAFFKGLE